MRFFALCIAALLAIAAMLGAAACGSTSAMTATEAEQKLQRIVLTGSDLADGYIADGVRVQSNDDAAKARPDTDAARQQYAEWGQLLAYNVQFAPSPGTQVVYSGATARVMNTATMFTKPEGAAAALDYVRGLPESLVANFTVNDADGTKISDVQAVSGIDFTGKGDDSFALRLSGKATFPDGLTSTFVADSVYVRSGRVLGTVTNVALGEAPDRGQLERLVDAFVAKAQANG